MSTKLISKISLNDNEASSIVDGDFQSEFSILEFMGANSKFSYIRIISDDKKLFINGNINVSNSRLLFHLFEKTYKKIEKSLTEERWLPLLDEKYFDKESKGCWFLSENQEKNELFSSGGRLSSTNELIKALVNDPINEWEIPLLEELKKITKLEQSTTPFKLTKKRFSKFYNALYKKGKSFYGFDCDNNYLHDISNGYIIPFLRFEINESSEREIFMNLISKGLTPVSLEKDKDYELLVSILSKKGNFKELNSNTTADSLLSQEKNLLRIDELTENLLREDKIRADLAPYHRKILEDTELGHWSLWNNSIECLDEESTFSLPKPLVARDPKSSINDGVVGIDFGTKSTVVVYQKDNVNIHPMRIGIGDLSKDIKAFHYENPTIMEFNDLDSFITAYNEKANKPYTKWEDLTISHTAQNSLLGSDSSKFNTFLDELKQWAGDKNRKLKIVGKQGKVIDLPPFLELEENDFNPIEIYAYYLGLYINNLNNGIYLNYILSFPVTYEVPVRNKILASFERGLKKSLPEELDPELINQLNVEAGASEPAAYALVALQEYKFEPCESERIFYGVFDFGGGTTDFDFGIFREASGKKEKRYDYAIEHFGAGGDKFLGGENLLELLAFEIFKKNKQSLLASNIQFEKHPEKDAFAGSEQLLSHSQEAKINTKTLCEKLRPFWEARDDLDFDLSSSLLSLNLTDITGKVLTAFDLEVDESVLNKILFDRIERGVVNFFNALRLAFSNSNDSLHDIDNIKIFLAGNSSKSKLVTEIFNKHIALQDDQMGHNKESNSRFELYQPLGSNDDEVEKPTGKTGVAFGLIESRKGGSIKVIDHNVNNENIRFKFYVGENRKKRFKPIIDREASFNKWVEFIDAELDTFEFFYSEQPHSSTGEVEITDSCIKKRSIKLDMTEDDAMVYIRPVTPTKIEYVIAADEDSVNKEDYINQIQAIELV